MRFEAIASKYHLAMETLPADPPVPSLELETASNELDDATHTILDEGVLRNDLQQLLYLPLPSSL